MPTYKAMINYFTTNFWNDRGVAHCSKKINSQATFAEKMPCPRWIPKPRPTLCARLRHRNAHGHVIRAIFCKKMQVKGRRPRGRRKFSASLLNRNAHGHGARADLCENLRVKTRRAFCASLRNRNTHGHPKRAIIIYR
jgi:hypothetical protein